MAEKKAVPVWDIAVRIFHWSLAASFFIAYLSEDDFETLHVYAGYLVLALISFRLVWGLIGTKYARFSSFVCGFERVKRYLGSIVDGKPEHYLGHNPAGGLMIVIMLIVLFAISFSGLKTYATEGKGPLAQAEIILVAPAYADDDGYKGKGKRPGHKFWEEVHEVLANLMLLLVFIHIAGVIVSSLVHRENLVRAMVDGKKYAVESE